MTPVRSALLHVIPASPISAGGLTMVPLLPAAAQAPGDPRWLPLPHALATGEARVTEVSEGGSVPTLAVRNDGALPVLIMDGEELVGARQNRIVNITILVPGKATLPIPVSCVEQGRWSYTSREFAPSKQAMHGSARRGKAARVSESLRHGRAADADQGRVWADVDHVARSLGVRSATGAMSDVFARHDEELDAIAARLVAGAGQVGAVFVLGGTPVAVELFATASDFAAYLPKLARSWGIEAIARRARTASHAAVPDEPDAVDVDALLRTLADAPLTAHRAVGLGEDLRLGGRFAGGALVHEGEVVHLAAFPLPDDDGSHRRDRLEGMLLALAIGDSLGNTTESINPSARRAAVGGEIRGYLPNAHAGHAEVGLPSDDTQLAFWTLEHLLEHDRLVPQRLAERFCRERIYGIGSAVRAFVRAFKDEGKPWRMAGQPSAGNGALMRIAPVIVPYVARGTHDSGAMLDDVATAARITHDDPTSTSACIAFAHMLARLVDMRAAPDPAWWIDAYVDVAAPVEGDARLRSRVPGDDWDGPLWRFVDARVRRALATNASVLDAGNRWYSGAYLLETVPSVLYILARHAHDPVEAMVRAVNDTRDNDTVAAIVGAALGALHGTEWIPRAWREGLLGRTGAHDDGRVFRLIAEAMGRWGPDESFDEAFDEA